MSLSTHSHGDTHRCCPSEPVSRRVVQPLGDVGGQADVVVEVIEVGGRAGLQRVMDADGMCNVQCVCVCVTWLLSSLDDSLE